MTREDQLSGATEEGAWETLEDALVSLDRAKREAWSIFIGRLCRVTTLSILMTYSPFSDLRMPTAPIGSERRPPPSDQGHGARRVCDECSHLQQLREDNAPADA